MDHATFPVTQEASLQLEQNKPFRITSIDWLRGLVMVLMAIDHVRVYAGVPPGGPEPAIFFTRWVTHFCAPAFAFFAGTSIFLYAVKVNNPASVVRFVVTRGLLLMVLELTLIRFFWTFNLNLSEFMLAGVIWMLGLCMVVLPLFLRMNPKVVGLIGLAIISCQQVFSFVPKMFSGPAQTSFASLWEFIYPSGFETFSGISVLYTLVPWIGVMAAGFGFGSILLMDDRSRKKLCFLIGGSAVVIFLLLGSFLAAENGSDFPFLLRLLNQQKYPASQLFLLMTLGPTILLVPFVEKSGGYVGKFLETMGRVPFFYYLMHIPVIHLSALLVNRVRNGSVNHEWYSYAPYALVPEDFRWSLLLLYAVFVVDIAILFLLCRWYSRFKSENPHLGWLKYL